MKNKYIIGLVVIGLVGAGGLIWSVKGGHSPFALLKRPPASQASTVVATFNNGETNITRTELDAQIKTLGSNPQVKVPEVSDTEARVSFERLVLTQMIHDNLLFSEAQRQGFTADDAAINAELTKITGQYKDTAAFEAALISASLDQETLRKNIGKQLIVNQYSAKVATEHNVAVTPEEIKVFYDAQVAKQNPELKFDDIKGQIQAHLEQQKT